MLFDIYIILYVKESRKKSQSKIVVSRTELYVVFYTQKREKNCCKIFWQRRVTKKNLYSLSLSLFVRIRRTEKRKKWIFIDILFVCLHIFRYAGVCFLCALYSIYFVFAWFLWHFYYYIYRRNWNLLMYGILQQNSLAVCTAFKYFFVRSLFLASIYGKTMQMKIPTESTLFKNSFPMCCCWSDSGRRTEKKLKSIFTCSQFDTNTAALCRVETDCASV